MFLINYLKSSFSKLEKRLDLLLKKPQSPSWRRFEAVRPKKIDLPFVINLCQANSKIKTQNDLVNELRCMGYKYDQARVSRLFSGRKSSLKRLKYLIEALKNYEPPSNWG